MLSRIQTCEYILNQATNPIKTFIYFTNVRNYPLKSPPHLRNAIAIVHTQYSIVNTRK